MKHLELLIAILTQAKEADLEAGVKLEDDVLTYAIKNANVPGEVLAQLSTHESIDIRAEVAGHKNTPAETLAALSKDEQFPVRYWVAENPNTPAEVLSALNEDEHFTVRYCLARNPSTPLATLQLMAQDNDASIAGGACETIDMFYPGANRLSA